MRVLLIEEDPLRCAEIQQRLCAHRPDAQLVIRSPQSQGQLPPEFLAFGFDAVMLTQRWKTGSGLDWIRELGARPGFAPIVFLAEHADDPEARNAMALGAHASIGREELGSGQWLQVLDSAERRQSRARARRKSSEAGMHSQRFGEAFIRGYHRIRQLAAGPVSDLYLAESEATDTLVVLKVARDRHQEQSELDHTFRRFLQEYAIVQRIRHPSIVRLYDLGISDEHAWVVMEYFRAGDLRKRMRAGMRARPALRAAIAIARALQATHACGVLHRDLKPGNVMLREDGSLALIDFGFSKDLALSDEVTDTGLIFGTPHYMSPEQGHGEPIDARSDLYSLGVIVFEMLAREKPYAAENPMAIIYKHRKEPVPQLPPRYRMLQPLIERLLAKDPADRFADAAQAAAALEDAYRLLKPAPRGRK